MGALDVSPLVTGPPHFPLLKPVELLRRLRDPAPPVAGLLMDVAGVLYDDTIWSRWLFKLLARLGLHTNFLPFFRVFEREFGPRIKRGEFDYWQALRAFLRSAGLSKGQIDEVEAAGHARQREFECERFSAPGRGERPDPSSAIGHSDHGFERWPPDGGAVGRAIDTFGVGPVCPHGADGDGDRSGTTG